MKQRYFKTILSIVGSTLLLISCSSDEMMVQTNRVSVDGSRISMSVAPYETATQKSKSRAVAELVKEDTMLLSNGQRAIVSTEEDSESPATSDHTRAAVADGHYTIYACDPITGDRITGTNTLLTGTFSGGTFTPDAGSQLVLDPGTYKFVCFNDAFEIQGNSLILKTAYVQTNGVYPHGVGNYSGGKDALLGTATETISGGEWKVTFVLKHQTARVRVRLVVYTDHLDNVHGGFSDGFTFHPVALKYSADGENPTTYMASNGHRSLLAGFAFPATSADFHATYVKAHQFMSNDMFICPGMLNNAFSTGNAIAGNVYAEALGSIMATINNPVAFLRNHSYTITFRILPGDLYLFEDGSCGAYSEKGSRTPIAAVVTEKTATEDGLAIALKDDYGAGLSVLPWGVRGGTTQQYNNVVKATVADVIADMDGYKYTWEAAGSHDGVTVKANDPTMEAFYKAANHTSPAPITFGGGKRGKWFLPSLGQWVLALKALGKASTLPTDLVSSGGSTTKGYVDITYLNRPFTAAGVGGEALDNYWYWTSTQYHTLEACSIDFVDGGPDSFQFTSEPTGRVGENVRAFIYF